MQLLKKKIRNLLSISIIASCQSKEVKVDGRKEDAKSPKMGNIPEQTIKQKSYHSLFLGKKEWHDAVK